MKKLLILVGVVFVGAAVLRTLLPVERLAGLKKHLSAMSEGCEGGCQCGCHGQEGSDAGSPEEEGAETTIT